jgi:hypothetical protein
LPAGTFFDLAVVHVLTTATVERLRTLYPEGRFEVRRLRPKIVVSTGLDQQGFVEKDSIGQTITIGEEVRCGLPALSSLRDDRRCHRAIYQRIRTSCIPPRNTTRRTSASTRTWSRAAPLGAAIQSRSRDRPNVR